MIRMFTSAGSFAAAMAFPLVPRITVKMMIQMAIIMHWRINAEMALLKCVYFVTPQNWRCQE
jgi:hypothetical protein